MSNNVRAGRAGVAGILLATIVTAVGIAPAAAAEVRDTTRFACAPSLTTFFRDIGGTTHERSIACAVHYELTGGTSATTFSPNNPVSRGQMATFLARFFGIIDVAPGDFAPTGFTDIAGTPHEGSIEAVVELGLARGTSATTYSPSAPVSRAQMATFLEGAMDLMGLPPAPAAPDAFDDDDGIPNEPDIQAIADAGIAGGTGPRTYRPSDSVTRGAMTSFLVRLADLGIELGRFIPIVTDDFPAAMVGEAVTPGPGHTDASGTVVVYVTDVPNVICVQYVVEGLAPTAAAIHRGAAGATGPSVLTLPTPVPGTPTSLCLSDPIAESIRDGAEGFYVEVTTSELPNGALRGQLGDVVANAEAELVDTEVVPGPGDPDASGFAQLLTTTQPGTICAAVYLFSDEASIGGHLHVGPEGMEGQTLLTFEVVEVDDPDAPASLGLDCQLSEFADDFAADPGNYFVDIHTTSFEGGAVRGQLVPITDDGAPAVGALAR